MQTRIILSGILVATLVFATLDVHAGPGSGSGKATTSCPPCQSIADAITEKRAEIDLAEYQLDNETRAENRLVEQARPIRTEIGELESQKEQLAQDIAALATPLRNARNARSQLSWFQAWAQGVSAELDELQNQTIDLQAELGRVQARLDVLQPELDRIKEDLVDTRRRIREIEDDLERLRPELQGLERALAECEKQCQTTTGGGGGGGSGGITVGVPGGTVVPPEGEGDEGDDGDASTSCVPCTALTDTINELIAELRDLKKATKEAKAERDRIMGEISSKGDQIRDARFRISELQQQQSSQQANVDHLDNMNWKYGSGGIIDNFGSRLEAAEEALEETQAAIAAAEASIESLQAEIDALDEPHAEAAQKYYDLADQVQAKQAAIDGLFRMLSECENQCRVSVTPKIHIKVGNEYGAADVFSPAGNNIEYRVLPPGVFGPAPDPGQDAAVGVGDVLDAVLGMQEEDPHVSPEPEQPRTTNPCDQN